MTKKKVPSTFQQKKKSFVEPGTLEKKKTRQFSETLLKKLSTQSVFLTLTSTEQQKDEDE